MTAALYALVAVLAVTAAASLAGLAYSFVRGWDEDDAPIVLLLVAILFGTVAGMGGVAYHSPDKTCTIRPASVVEAGP